MFLDPTKRFFSQAKT